MRHDDIDFRGCDCQDPGCPDHAEHYRCEEEATGTLSWTSSTENNDRSEIEVCPGCAAATIDSLEMYNVEWTHLNETSGAMKTLLMEMEPSL